MNILLHSHVFITNLFPIRLISILFVNINLETYKTEGTLTLEFKDEILYIIEGKFFKASIGGILLGRVAALVIPRHAESPYSIVTEEPEQEAPYFPSGYPGGEGFYRKSNS